MAILDEKLREQLRNILANMKDTVNVVYFTQEFECQVCKDTHLFLDEFTELSDKIKLKVFDYVKDKDEADRFNVDKIPAIVINDKDNNDLGIKFYGFPGGYEINSFIISLLEVSGRKENLNESIASRIAAIKKKVHIQVFVVATCPYCPGAVSTAHRLALENNNIRADMVDCAIYPHLVQKYQVVGVPRIIINETRAIEGVQPIEKLLSIIEEMK